MIAGLLLLGSIAAGVFVSLDMYHWNIVSLVVSNFWPLVLLIIFIAVFIKIYLYFDGL